LVNPFGGLGWIRPGLEFKQLLINQNWLPSFIIISLINYHHFPIIF